MAPRIARRLSASGVVLLVASLLVAGPAAAEDSCGHLGARLTGWPTEDLSLQSHIDDLPMFYWGVEGTGDVQVTIQGEGHYCGTNPETTVKYATSNGSATAPSDYQAKSGQVTITGWDIDWEAAEVFIPIVDDSVEDSRGAEWFKFALTGGEANLLTPKEAPVFIVDNDGSHRVTLPDSPYNSVQISELTGAISTNPDVQIPIFRAGPATNQVVVPYTITPGAGVTGADYTDMSSGSVTIPANQRMGLIKLAITDDFEDEADEQLSIQIAAPAGTAVETATHTVTILDNDVAGGDQTAPKTSFHHPKHNKTYKRTNYLARTIHVFAPGEDLEPSGIEYAQTALRKTKTNGACLWWNGNGWTPDGCGNAGLHQHWLPTWFFDPWNDKLIYEYPKSPNSLDPLKPSIGTKVKNYFVYSRAEDNAGNMEETFEMGRNKNRFEIAP
jgi:hypothetical protein